MSSPDMCSLPVAQGVARSVRSGRAGDSRGPRHRREADEHRGRGRALVSDLRGALSRSQRRRCARGPTSAVACAVARRGAICSRTGRSCSRDRRRLASTVPSRAGRTSSLISIVCAVALVQMCARRGDGSRSSTPMSGGMTEATRAHVMRRARPGRTPVGRPDETASRGCRRGWARAGCATGRRARPCYGTDVQRRARVRGRGVRADAARCAATHARRDRGVRRQGRPTATPRRASRTVRRKSAATASSARRGVRTTATWSRTTCVRAHACRRRAATRWCRRTRRADDGKRRYDRRVHRLPGGGVWRHIRAGGGGGVRRRHAVDGDGCSAACVQGDAQLQRQLHDRVVPAGGPDGAVYAVRERQQRRHDLQHPFIKYGTTENAVPASHNGNDLVTWCMQLGFATFSGEVSYGDRPCDAPRARCSAASATTTRPCGTGATGRMPLVQRRPEQ
jgi:hypothetical protein